MEEIWKDVPGYRGAYQVSNHGSVVSFHNCSAGRILKPINQGRYLKVSLCARGHVSQVLIHRIVAETFIPNPDKKPEVNHINGVKTDNRAENLEWVTRKENEAHSRRSGLHDEEVKKRKKPVVAKCIATGECQEYESILKAAKTLDISPGSISKILQGHAYRCKGHTFFRKEKHDGEKESV